LTGPAGEGERAFCGKRSFQGDPGDTGLECGKMAIKTQYSGASNTPLKNLRVIESPFALSTPATPTQSGKD
jgi:hypothetical protein